MKTIKTRTTQPSMIGCWIDESCGKADTLNQRTVELAVEYGMTLHDEDRKLLARFDYDCAKPDDTEFLSELADEAVNYLNTLDLPAYCYFGFEDNSLFLMPEVESARESVEFVSSREQEEPDADYVGEWLHVNDHGNVTLYVRHKDGQDSEIWSIV